MEKCRQDVRQLRSTQCRLRHIKSISARNVIFKGGKEEEEDGLYFTMHSHENGKCFYTSETEFDTKNPNWKNFNWPLLSENLNTSLLSVVVRVWRKEELVTEERVVFKTLYFLGEHVPKDGLRFSQNSLIFEMFGGFYASDCSIWKGCVPTKKSGDLNYEIEFDAGLLRKSYDLNTMKRVHTVQRAIREMRSAVHRVRNNIHSKLVENENKSEMVAERKLLGVRIEKLREELAYQRQSLSKTISSRWDLDEENRLKDLEIDKNVAALRKSDEDLVERRRKLIDVREELIKTTAQLVLRRRQLVAELGFIYPIQEDVSAKGFTICGVYLPDSEDFYGNDDAMISTALGYVCHLICMSSQFLQVPLRYPVVHGGSRSWIYDFFLSTIPDTDREFPLFTRGKDKLHFKYGVYLLNKNIAQLRYYCGFNTNDLRCTLANLKTLLELRPITKMEPLTPVAVTEQRISTPKLKESHRFQEDASGSSDSLNLDTLRHKRPLWKPSPECCRSSTLSVSLDHGLDELVLDLPATMTVSSTSADLRMSEPSLHNKSTENGGLMSENGKEPTDTIVEPYKLYGSESEPDEAQLGAEYSKNVSVFS